jgi:hypothetical protein
MTKLTVKQFTAAILAKLGTKAENIATAHSHDASYKPVFEFDLDKKKVRAQFDTGNTMMYAENETPIGGVYSHVLVAIMKKEGGFTAKICVTTRKNEQKNDVVNDVVLLEKKLNDFDTALAELMDYLGKGEKKAPAKAAKPAKVEGAAKEPKAAKVPKTTATVAAEVEISEEAKAIVAQGLSKNEAIRQMLALGMTVSNIAKALGLGYQRVKNVEKGLRAKVIAEAPAA